MIDKFPRQYVNYENSELSRSFVDIQAKRVVVRAVFCRFIGFFNLSRGRTGITDTLSSGRLTLGIGKEHQMKRVIRANDCRFQDDVIPIAQIGLVRGLCLMSLRSGKNIMWFRREPIESKTEKKERRK
ncbi:MULTISPECIES: hypothetical protein [Methylomonas]|uniref:hypothetical protein n=1 Tax=Methylomonas TaxID=416 RepID=UPI0012F6BF16|nr:MULTISPECIES: hypothetical protein [Methylomonas]